MRLKPFLKLLSKENVDRLVKEKGCCILYTHFAYDFVNEQGILSQDFKDAIDYLAAQNGWFVPASTILDYALADKAYRPSKVYAMWMDLKWLIEKVIDSIRL